MWRFMKSATDYWIKIDNDESATANITLTRDFYYEESSPTIQKNDKPTPKTYPIRHSYETIKRRRLPSNIGSGSCRFGNGYHGGRGRDKIPGRGTRSCRKGETV